MNSSYNKSIQYICPWYKPPRLQTFQKESKQKLGEQLMSSTKKEIVIPESVFQECFHLYTDVLTYSKQKSLEKLISHAYIAGTKHQQKAEEE